MKKENIQPYNTHEYIENNYFSPQSPSSKIIANVSPLNRSRVGKGLRRNTVKTVSPIYIDASMNYNISGKFGHELITTLPFISNLKKISTLNIEENFTSLKFLCEGSHSRIYKAILLNPIDMSDIILQEYNSENENKNYMTTKNKAIVKQMKVSSIGNNNAIREFEREKNFLLKFSHPNIVSLYAFGEDLTLQTPFFVIERLDGGTLSSFIANRRHGVKRPFTYGKFLAAVIDFCSALKYLHHELPNDIVVIHRDLKPDNLGFTSTGRLKIIDFGLCICVRRSEMLDEVYELTGCTGSLRYMAYEVAIGEKYNEKADIYGFGMIMYEMMTGDIPFQGFTKNRFMSDVIDRGLRPSTVIDDYGKKIRLDKELLDLIEIAWDSDLKVRPTAIQIYDILIKHQEKHNDSLKTLTGTLKDAFFSRFY